MQRPTRSRANVVPMHDPSRLTAEQGANLRHLLGGLDQDELPIDLLHELRAVIDRRTDKHRKTRWRFTMLSRDQFVEAYNRITALPGSARPVLARDAFMHITLNLRWDTGEILLTREQIAEKIGCDPNDAGRVMTTLERLGIVWKKRERLPGVRGPGRVVYFVNANLAWEGSEEARQRAAEEQPELPFAPTVIDGGKQ